MKTMEEDFENIIRSQLRVLKNQMDVIKDYLNKYEERNNKLRHIITNNLIEALIERFERNEKIIQDLNEKLDSLHIKFNENLSRSIKDVKEEIIDAELTRAISKLLDEKEIKVDSKALEELKEF